MTSSALESFELFQVYMPLRRFQQLQIIPVMCGCGKFQSQMTVCHVFFALKRNYCKHNSMYKETTRMNHNNSLNTDGDSKNEW